MSRKTLKFRLGIGMISLSVVAFLTLFAIPFLSVTVRMKLALTPVLLIAGEVLFWGGILLIGKDVYLKFKEKLQSGSWLSKKDSKPADPD
jgi:hypothetical protein